MIMTLLALVIILAIAYMWVIRGFFSALLHLICTVLAGAIAFGVWEWLAYLLLDNVTQPWARGSVWGIALVVPFGVSLAVLRVLSDKLISRNAQCDPTVDYVGGGVCGLLSGVITAGFVVLGLGFLHVKHEFMGYAAADFTQQGTARGSIEENKSFFRPYVDEITARMYSHLSLASFSSSTPLAAMYPNLHVVPAAQRMTYSSGGMGASRTTLAPDDFTPVLQYSVGDPARGESTTQLTNDEFQPGVPQGIIDVEGEPIARGYIAGYVVSFQAGARETSGRFVVGNGQVRLVVENAAGDDWKTLFPIAAVSQAGAGPRSIGRWRYDGDEVFIASVGGASNVMFGFEFLVPQGYTPTHFYLKNARVKVSDFKKTEWSEMADTTERDQRIEFGDIFEGAVDVTRVPDDDEPQSGNRSGNDNQGPAPGDEIKVVNSLSFAIQKGGERGLNVANEGRGFWIVGGDAKFSREEIDGKRFVEQNLRINRFAVTPDVNIVQVDVSPDHRTSLLGRSVATAESVLPPTLVDNFGNRYEPVGYVYRDSSKYEIYFKPGQPIRAMSQVPSLSRSRSDQELQLIFRVTKGVEVVSFNIGNKVIAEYDPPVNVDRNQK